MSDWNRQIIEAFRSNRGKVGGSFEGAPLLLLTLPLFLIGWEAVSGLSRNPMEVYFWLVGSFAGLSGLYWLGTYALEFLQAYRRGGWTAVEQAMTRARKFQD
ncbi:MAG TPA: hypothetical protein VFN02_12740 [Ktedonobacteraceae bacterium]|nr:hypothetical protein [Ktedonobacteraceae bacterium]